LVINPLKHALAHYEVELLEVLNSSGHDIVEIADVVPGDRVTGPLHRIAVATRTVWQRERIAQSVNGRIVIIIWPLFGYFDPLTVRRLARRNTVYLIVHDPTALRRPFGQFSWARKLFRNALSRRHIRVIYHTECAQSVGAHDSGMAGTVVPHPICMSPSGRDQRALPTASRPVVRVLGQYKHNRSLAALALIADRAAGAYELEVHGHGWPEVDGWKVSNRFIPEHEFTDLVESSDCVVIAYDAFFQSGVAARCFEAGIPVVAPVNEHVAQLYGDDWAGTVRDASDWCGALVRALAVDSAEIRKRHFDIAPEIRNAWQDLLSKGT